MEHFTGIFGGVNVSTLNPICVKFDNTTGRFPAVANSAQSQATRELAPLPMNFSVLVHFTHLGKSVCQYQKVT
jgi:hypothetical protein